MKTQIGRVWTPETERNYVLSLIATAPPPARSLLRSFARWLERDCRCAMGTIGEHLRAARSFVAAVCDRQQTSGAKALRLVTATEIEDFFIHYAKANGPGARRTMQAALRSLLKFARSRGWVDEGLATAVPSVRRYRLAGLPRALPDADFEQLLSTILDGDVSPRDQAIVLLLACYGIRRGQVSGLRLDDINWRTRTILFRPYKRGKATEHVLLPVIADALVRYLRDERSFPGDEFVFLRKYPPHCRLSPSAVLFVVHRCMRRAGLEPRGPHALRHSFACRQLRSGHSLKTIADLLGHRSLAAVAVYAKVDQPRLLEAAVEWPEVRS
ncbi:MAG TPA: tyrosine-type recombinase/integrase [Solirubrobacteraceae bacterium]